LFRRRVEGRPVPLIPGRYIDLSQKFFPRPIGFAPIKEAPHIVGRRRRFRFGRSRAASEKQRKKTDSEYYFTQMTHTMPHTRIIGKKNRSIEKKRTKAAESPEKPGESRQAYNNFTFSGMFSLNSRRFGRIRPSGPDRAIRLNKFLPGFAGKNLYRFYPLRGELQRGGSRFSMRVRRYR
jgi:hypothetical protein